MLRCLVLSAITLAAMMAPAVAAPVRIMSGEHVGYSRLVFATDGNRSWKVDRVSDDRAVIVFSGPPLEFDPSRVFDLIPKGRIEDISTENNELSLALGCACEIDVFSIPTGHIVIDVKDAKGPRPGSAASVEPEQTGSLPVVLEMPSIGIDFPAPDAREYADFEDPVEDPQPSQTRFYPEGSVPITLREPTGRHSRQPIEACPIEDVATDILQANPRAALDEINAGRPPLLNDQDDFSATAAKEYAHLLLKAGWGTEAIKVIESLDGEYLAIQAIGAALDGTVGGQPISLDPACGPATTFVRLLLPEPVERWDRADQASLIAFVDTLPVSRRADLEPRLLAALTHLAAFDVVDTLRQTSPKHVTSGTIGIPPAAGTDGRALEEVMRILTSANDAGAPIDELNLANAVAMLPSLPESDRKDLAPLLARAFVFSGHPGEAAAYAGLQDIDANALLTDALDTFPDETAAEFAIRLRPHLDMRGDPARRAAALFETMGLEDTAASFAPEAAKTSETRPQLARPEDETADPWLERSFPAMAETPPNEWTTRNRLADAIVTRNGRPRLDSDLAAANQVLEESRTVAALIADLIQTDGSTVTGR